MKIKFFKFKRGLKVLSERSESKGFTFIELIVVLSIFAVMAGITLFGYRDFSNNITLQNLASQIALQIKQAQSDAIAGKNPSLFTGICLNGKPCAPSFGVYFEVKNPKQFIYFADTDNNGQYDSSELLETININGANKIGTLNVFNGSSGESSIAITFKRPFPDAIITSGGFVDTPQKYSQAEITVNNSSQSRKITVNSLGQISVQ